jgi:allantoinase
VKAFMCDSGLPEFPASGEVELRAALPILGRRCVPLLVHAEVITPLESPPSPVACYWDWLTSRPQKFERDAVVKLFSLAMEYKAPIHVVHLANAFETMFFSKAKEMGLPLTAEACPHYLYFCSEQLRDADPRFKCAPPIRRDFLRRQLWQGLMEGVIDTIGSDHSPCTPEMKCLESNDWQRAWGGVSSVQLTLSVVWRALPAQVPFTRLAEWLSRNPARLTGLADRKGAIAPAMDADLCVWDPDEEWTVVGSELHHRHKLTPYEGERLRGRVKRTYVRGRLVYDEGKFPAGTIGELLKRGT